MAPSISFPPSGSAAIETLDGSNWASWQSRIQALLRMNGLRNHVTSATPDPNDTEWAAKEEIILGVLEMYCQKDVWNAVSDPAKFTTCHTVWKEIKRLYGGIGAMSSFNTWVALTRTNLDESIPMLPQLQKLNDARVTLESNNMKVSDIQFCFILIQALPESWTHVASTILAIGDPANLTAQIISDRIINEESRRSGASASLNKIAPIKKNGDKADKSKIKCYYCQKNGHKSNECRKKKKDTEENETKGKGSGAQTTKSVNAHMGTASIEEVDDNDDLPVSLYAAARSRWMVDSGATHHITPHRSDFTNWTPAEGVVSLGGHAEIRQTGTGTVTIHPSGGTKIVHLHNVMHVPDAGARYFSVSALMQKGGQITFKDNKLSISVRGRHIASGYQEGNLFWIDASNATLHAISNAPTSLHLWHARMGHMSHQALKRYKDSVKGIALDPSLTETDAPCPGCELGKQTRSPFSDSSKRSDRRLQIVHSDLAGPMQTRSIQGSLYIATFIDDYSKHGVVYYLKSKDQCAAAFKKFLAWAENQTSDRLLALHSDRGGEYLSGAVRSILDEKGIEHRLTMPHTPQQNGLAERWNRTILDKARALMHSAGLSLGFWELAVDTAVHTYNRTPSRTIKWRTPHELWADGHVPDVSYFCVFGCKAYVHTPEAKRKKLDPRSIEMTLVGYELGSKGYRLWNANTRSIVLSRDVTFDERSFPYKALSQQAIAPTQPTLSDGPVTITYNTNNNSDGGPAPQVPTLPTQLPTTPAQHPTPDRAETEFHTPLSQPAALTPPQRPQPTRVRRDPGVPPRSALPGPSFGPATPPSPRRLRENPRPNPRYANPTNVVRIRNRTQPREGGQANHISLVTALLNAAAEYQDPLTFREAMRSALAETWQEACQYEMDALAKNETWVLVDLPPGRKAVKSKWVFKRKLDLRFRARVVAKGFTQIFELDYNETFSPVARFESLRLLLALAALEDWEIHQMDVKSAFLNGLLDEEIYMEQPEGFVDPDHPDKVCLLKKAIYGLKQASRAWNQQFHKVLLDLGLTRTRSDAGVYHRQDDRGTLIIILYVDDITILGDSLKSVNEVKSQLSKRYEMTDLGEIESYLGVRVKRDRSIKRLEIDQSRYVLEIVNRFGLSDAHSTPTPLPAGADKDLRKYDGQATTAEIKLFQQMIGSLLYVQIGTRPDIAFAVSRLSQYASNPSPQHIRLAKYVITYLKGTSDLKLRFDGAGANGLYGYSDSSWANDPDDLHSTSGYVFLLADAAISWCSRKQKTTAQSTCEAEYMELADAGNQAMWYRMFLEELGYDVRDPILLHEDNKGAFDLSLNPVTGRKSKHIPIKYHVIRDYIENNQVEIIKVPTADQLADGLTKPLAHAPLSHFVSGLGLI
jgi:Reverse transcriptase (RNA-dependent DNA polymerase)/Integrase core domain/gag-polypeptide of LTR copia-type/GAG-pre-integrase domain